ncbi:glycosyltransferase family 2 protein [Humidesulfovibrio idahonensis]
MSLHDLACIIVHHGDIAVTQDCVASLLAGCAPPQIIVICNAADSVAESLEQLLLQGGAPCRIVSPGDKEPGQAAVRIIPAGANLGFARGCNLGIALALRSSGVRWLWLLNNDTWVNADAPALLRECLEHNARAIVGTAVVRDDEPARLELTLGCRFSPATSILRPQGPGALLDEAILRPAPGVDYVYGASLAFPAEMAREVGLLNEAFFLYYEEFDLCVRARAAGYAFRWCPAAVVRHGTGRSAGATREGRAMRHHHETLSTFLFLLWHHRWALWTAVPFRTVAKLVLLPLRGEVWLLPSYFSGLVMFLRRALTHGDTE